MVLHRKFLLALASLAVAARGETHLKAWQVSVDGDVNGGFVAEQWGSNRVDLLEVFDEHGIIEGLAVRGNNRLFAISDYVWAHKWRDVTYKRFATLVDRALSFTVDLSGVPCGCNAAVYLVPMSDPNLDDSAYCDIQGYDDEWDAVQPCLEIDLLEGNAKAIQATLHTTKGRGADGYSCNQDGCYSNLGKVGHGPYGMGMRGNGSIDSARPFHVTATFTETHVSSSAAQGGAGDGAGDGDSSASELRGAQLDVTLSQDADAEAMRVAKTLSPLVRDSFARTSAAAASSVHLFNPLDTSGSHSLDGTNKAVPERDQVLLRDALTNGNGMVLVLSLWGGQSDLEWLDGGCADWIHDGNKKYARRQSNA